MVDFKDMSIAPQTAGAVPLAIHPEQLHAIIRARQQARKIMRAAGVATFSGWSCVVLASLTMLMGIFSLVGFVLGAGLMVIAIIELRSSAALRRFDVTAPRRLALNQMALMAMLIAYCGWNIYAAMTGPGMYDEYLQAGDDMAATLEPIANLHKMVTLGFYAAVIAGTCIAQGLMAVYYFTRRQLVAAYLQSTPQWTVEALRAAA